ncbi:aldehyde dehydrogenase domain-containing protein [Hyaloraphidium curvatum]|nr:aldehyde dehydrogenase domain-containing protein [Hyaloraphidium curvatum]
MLMARNCAGTVASLSLATPQANQGVFDGEWRGSGERVFCLNPSTGRVIAEVATGSKEDLDAVSKRARAAWDRWKRTPMPTRGAVVRDIGATLRLHKPKLARLISLEVGKLLAEAESEVQEFIDMTELALGLSRKLEGKTLPSERKQHLLLEAYHPLGVVGIITTFNSPCAVYGWNMSVALVCGNTTVWKPALSTNLVAIAMTKLISKVLIGHKVDPAVASLCTGTADIGEALCRDDRYKLVSFTGSTAVGRNVGVVVQERFGRTVLQLGGNNAIIVMDDADMALALRGTVFSAIGSTGQRCTSTRRLLVQQSSYDAFVESLVHAYRQIRIGDPLEPRTMCGPLHKPESVDQFRATIEQAKKEGGEVIFGGDVLELPGDLKGGLFVRPAIIKIDPFALIVQRETFAPILYTAKFKKLDEAIQINNSVPQGLASALFTTNMRASFRFTSVMGSDCGIVNVNVPTSGTEIGSAFGGEKESGGGREGGSDSWKIDRHPLQAYMRRVSATINYGHELPPAQGINFHSAQVEALTDTAEGHQDDPSEVHSALNTLVGM